MNVGASAPELAGGYYAWGETEQKEFYNEDYYLYSGKDGKPYFFDFGNISGTQYDVAKAVLGGDWLMPTSCSTNVRSFLHRERVCSATS